MSIDASLEFHVGEDTPHARSLRTRKRGPDKMYKFWGGSATGTAPLVVPVTQAVPPGRIYNVFYYNLFATDGHTNLASAVADVYLASEGVVLPDYSCQIGSGLAVPVPGSGITYSKEVMWAEPEEKLIAIVYGFASTATVTIVGKFADYCQEEVEQLWIPAPSQPGSHPTSPSSY